MKQYTGDVQSAYPAFMLFPAVVVVVVVARNSTVYVCI